MPTQWSISRSWKKGLLIGQKGLGGHLVVHRRAPQERTPMIPKLGIKITIYIKIRMKFKLVLKKWPNQKVSNTKSMGWTMNISLK